MNKKILIITLVILLISTSVYADGVSIDSDGNVITGTSNTDANLEVIGSPAEHAIVGETSGGAAAGVYGVNTNFGNYGILGYDLYGVYGYSETGDAGFFEGDVHVMGDLNVTGDLLGFTETDPVFSGSSASGITSGQITNWDNSFGWGDHSLAGYLTSETDPQVGANTTNYVPRWDGSALVTGSIYDNGNVGIGTTTPTSKLEVRSGGHGYLVYLYKDNNISLTTSAVGLFAAGDSFDAGGVTGIGGSFLGIGGSTSGYGYGIWSRARAYGSSSAYGVFSDGTEGTTTGTEYSFWGRGKGYFEYNKSGNSTNVIHAEYSGTSGSDAKAVYGKSTPQAWWGYGGYFEGGFKGVQGISTLSGAGVRYGVYGAAGNGSTTNYGVYGTTSGSAGNRYAVYADGVLAHTGGIVSISDAKFKESVQTLEGAGILSKIMQVRSTTYTHTESPESAHINLSSGKQYGFIAQELEQVFPELVVEAIHPSKEELAGEKGGEPLRYKGVKYMEMIPILVQAVQEQQIIIEDLQNTIEDLK